MSTSNTRRPYPRSPIVIGDTGYLILQRRPGLYVIHRFDAADVDLVTRFKWHLHTKGYARSESCPLRYLHRVIGRAAGINVAELSVDHANRDVRDHRRTNLREATATEQRRNRGPAKNVSITGYVGIKRSPRKHGPDRFMASVGVGTEKRHLGTFDTIGEAVAARNRVVSQLHGEFAYIQQVEVAGMNARDATPDDRGGRREGRGRDVRRRVGERATVR